MDEPEDNENETFIPVEKQEKYSKIISERRDQLKEVINNPKLWKRKKKKKGIELFTYRGKFDDSSFNCYLCRMSIDTKYCESPEAYYIYESQPLLDGNLEIWKKRDKYVEDYKIVEKYEFSEKREFYLVYQLLDPGTSILNKREFVYMNEKYIEDNGDIFELGTPLVGEDNDHIKKFNEEVVRATQTFACSIRKVESKICVNLLYHCDFSGNVPSFLFNLSSSSSVFGILERGKKYFESLDPKEKEKEEEEEEEGKGEKEEKQEEEGEGEGENEEEEEEKEGEGEEKNEEKEKKNDEKE